MNEKTTFPLSTGHDAVSGDSEKMRAVELFTGAGGLALGLEQAGFEGVAFVERDTHSCATLRLNRPRWNIVESDARRIDFEAFGDTDLVAGGPPCQPFSMGGRAKGNGDKRDMFPEAVRAVRELRPRAFIFENVRGLMRPAFRNYVEFIRLQMIYPEFPVSANVDWEQNYQRLQRHHTARKGPAGLRYRVSIHLADAADFGVPQRRHRVFFVGFREDVDAKWFFPTPTHDFDSLLRDQYITGEYWRRHGIRTGSAIPPRLRAKITELENPLLPLQDFRPWLTVRDALIGLPHPKESNSFDGHSYQPGAKSYPGHTGSLLDEPSKALKAGDHGVPGGENMLRYPNGKIRYFSVRESARIQTFPDDYQFHGSWTECMRQIGNAVPVRLAHAVADSVASKLRVHAGNVAHLHRQSCPERRAEGGRSRFIPDQPEFAQPIAEPFGIVESGEKSGSGGFHFPVSDRG